MRDWRIPLQYPSASVSPTRLAWEFLRRSPTYVAAWEAGDMGTAKFFSIGALVDPDGDQVPDFTCTGVALTAPDSPALSAAGRAITGTIAITFDAGRAIEPQIAAAARGMRAWAGLWRRTSGDCLPRIPGTPRCVLALRCLDGRAAGATIDEIAKTLIARARPRRSALDALALADRLVAGEYRRIAERESVHLDVCISLSSTAPRNVVTVVQKEKQTC